ncbi:MAG TPA: NAD(P)H-dependent glycerol-3-phosphate dehydrogenase [Stellaceae bacterium]
MKRLTIVGGGAWGTALAIVAARAGSVPVIWARDPSIVTAIEERHENPVYLPEIGLDPAIAARHDFGTALAEAEAVLLAVPAQSLRSVLTALAVHLPAGLPLLHCAKGIEAGSLATMSEIGREILPASPFAVLSGPSFAVEIARGLPAAVTIASHDAALARAFTTALAGDRFRPYLSDDPIGAEIGGAVKNVLAIACGMILGRGFGDNARAALITRGLAEMIRLGLAKGGRAETFAGLSGIGDLVLTCSAVQSRNYALGLALGRGATLGEVLTARHTTVEGVATAAAVVELAHRLGVEMPISEAVDTVLHRGFSIDAMADRLLRRPHRTE